MILVVKRLLTLRVPLCRVWPVLWLDGLATSDSLVLEILKAQYFEFALFELV